MKPKFNNKYGLMACFCVWACALLIYTGGVHAQDEKTVSASQEPLSLKECVKFSADNSFEIKLARLDFLIAETDIGIKEAVFDTSLFGDISYKKDKLEQISVFAPDTTITNTYSAGISKKLQTGTELTLQFDDQRQWSDSAFITRNPAHTAQASAELRQPLANNIFGYVDRRSLSSTRLAVQNSDLDTKDRIEVLFSDVEKAYWNWVYSKKNLETHQKILQMAKDLHGVNVKSFDAGRIEKGDLLASEANILVREKDLLLAENDYRGSEETIKLLMNMNPYYRISPKENLQYRKRKINLEDCLKKAFETRRDYHKAKTEIERNKIILQTKANERWPELDLVASMKANGINQEFSDAVDRIGTGNAEYYAGIEVTVPIENREARGEFKKAKHNKEKAIIELKEIEREIVTETGNAFRDYTTYETTVGTLEKTAQLQHDKLKEEEKSFRYGRSTTKTLIDYQQDYLNSELQAAKGLLDFETARVNLEKQLNTLLEKYEELL